MFWEYCEHINVAIRLTVDPLLPCTCSADLYAFVNDEIESVWIEIGLVDNVGVGIFGGSTFVYEGTVHYLRPVCFVTFLIGTDVIAVRTLESRQILQTVSSHSELIFHYIFTVRLSSRVPQRVSL